MSEQTEYLRRQLANAERQEREDEAHRQLPATQTQAFLFQNRITGAEVEIKDDKVIVTFTGVGGDESTLDRAELMHLKAQQVLGKKGIGFTTDENEGTTTLKRGEYKEVTTFVDYVGNLPSESEMQWVSENYNAPKKTFTLTFDASEVAAKIQPESEQGQRRA